MVCQRRGNAVCSAGALVVAIVAGIVVAVLVWVWVVGTVIVVGLAIVVAIADAVGGVWLHTFDRIPNPA